MMNFTKCIGFQSQLPYCKMIFVFKFELIRSYIPIFISSHYFSIYIVYLLKRRQTETIVFSGKRFRWILNQQIRKYKNLESKLNLYMISKGIKAKLIIKANEILKFTLTKIFWAIDDLIKVLRFERVKLNQKSKFEIL